MEGVKKMFTEIPKSPRDDRQYRGLQLKNEMKVLVISDSSTDKSAAAMDVHIGNLSDPDDFPGLAHFCEHMLFLGTEKYPSENSFTQFLSENGGSSNAFTGGEHTNFFFDIKHECLNEALDRFAQFFLCPLFNSDATDREVNAVESEHLKNILNDSWRLNQLDKSTVDPSHPFSRFGTGNKLTLDTRPKEKGLSIRDELLKFHSSFYSANIMALVVLGRESLDDLTNLTIKLFSDAEDKCIAIPEFPVHPYGDKQLQVEFKVVPVKDIKHLNISFPIPDVSQHYESKPCHYISHLLGHEGKGSLLSELKTRGWVNELMAGGLGGGKGFSFFICNMELTTEGQEHIYDVVICVFQYLEMLRSEEPQEWVFKECQALSEVKYRFKDKENPRSYVCSTARCLHDFGIEDVIQGQFLIRHFRPDLIKMILSHLVPSKVRITVISKAFEGKTDLQEEWYGTEYSVSKISPKFIEEWNNVSLNPSLQLPVENEFIPTDFTIRGRPEDSSPIPTMIKDGPLLKAWFKQDDTFNLPKACMLFEITSPLAYVDPGHCNMARLFVELLKDSLNEYAYNAEIAGVDYKIENTMYGICLSIKGYNHKQPVLLKKIFDRMTSFQIDPKRFPVVKERCEISLKNFAAEQPHQHALYYTSFLLEELAWHKDELLEALEEVTLEKLAAFIPNLLARLHVECLLHGNMTKEEALDTVHLVEENLKENSKTKPLVPVQLIRHREIQLPSGCSYLYEVQNEVHNNSSLEIYYQCDLQATKSNVLLELFCQIINEPCFNTLRTKEQLGYIVFSGTRRCNGAQGLHFLIQSEKEPTLLDSRVENFILEVEDYIQSMSDQEFRNHVEALAVRRLDKPKKLSSECTKHWKEILSRQYNFDRDNVEVAFLMTVKKEDILNFYKDLIAFKAPRRHKLAVYILSKSMSKTVLEKGTNHAVENGEEDDTNSQSAPTIIDDVAAFKSSLPLFPVVPAYHSKPTKSKL
ncbi:PREDICTED: insulin-degrading enzyme-like [Acropora digitifera]|uniref:insulin-degrading enzyme-like n=1 Tax=Acropora digitifera TaxID=70779 RepID=UPI00077A1669|nr:PREDICTED: insulin-degrading enzyme-like [Acropora digitifera]